MTSTGQSIHALRFQCVRCNTTLDEAQGQSLACGACQAVYPSVADIKILVSNPNSLLAAIPSLLSESRIEVENRLELALTANRGVSSAEALDRIKDGYRGLLANLDVIEEQILPVKQYLNIERPRKAFYGDFVRPAWQILSLLPYFYRDWYGTEEFRFLNHLFTSSIREHCKDKRDSIAVLGAGACGLVYEVAESFDTVFGLDLSVDALLMANRLLNGGEVDLYFNFPGDESVICREKVTLRGPANKRRGIRLIAADVNRLPISSQSLSCVITQYLLDIVPSQKALAREIHRVLSPGGVWINFSLPLASTMADLSTALDLPQFLGRIGFELIETSTHRYNFLDFSPVSSLAYTYTQPVVFFATRKNESRDDEPRSPFAAYFSGESDRVWTVIPKLRTDISVGRQHRFGRLGVSEQHTLVIEKIRPEQISVSGETAKLAEWILQKLTESKTIESIADEFRKFGGQGVPEAEIIEFFDKLYEWQFIDIEE